MEKWLSAAALQSSNPLVIRTSLNVSINILLIIYLFSIFLPHITPVHPLLTSTPHNMYWYQNRASVCSHTLYADIFPQNKNEIPAAAILSNYQIFPFQKHGCENFQSAANLLGTLIYPQDLKCLLMVILPEKSNYIDNLFQFPPFCIMPAVKSVKILQFPQGFILRIGKMKYIIIIKSPDIHKTFLI